MSYASSVKALSQRQKDVLAWWCQGAKLQAIADRLHVKYGTVNEALAQIMWKLDIEDRQDLHRYAIEHGYDHVNVEVFD